MGIGVCVMSVIRTAWEYVFVSCLLSGQHGNRCLCHVCYQDSMGIGVCVMSVINKAGEYVLCHVCYQQSREIGVCVMSVISKAGE